MFTAIYVSLTGNDAWAGTQEKPFATIARAQQAVREKRGKADKSITVILRAGSYYLSQPLKFEPEDGGTKQTQVVYQAYGHGTKEAEKVIISGGHGVTKWHLYDKAKNIWCADIGAIETRQLFVNGTRATRATTANLPNLTRTSTGYTTTDTSIQEWQNVQDIEFIYNGVYPWAEARVGVARISSDKQTTTITMDQPAFKRAIELYAGTYNGQSFNGMDRPTRADNSVSFLHEPGSFAIDCSKPDAHKLYYIPRADENMQTTKAVVPLLQTVVEGYGTAKDPLQNLSFRGLSFQHATWLGPSSNEGFLHFHGGMYYNGGPLDTVTYGEGTPDAGSVTTPTTPAVMPSTIAFRQAQNIAFEDCEFTKLGANALEFSQDASHNLVRGCVFHDVSGSALVIGTVTSNGKATNQHNRVENNWIHDIGCDYPGVAGIYVSEAQQTLIAHNQINDVPHNGIAVNGGQNVQGVHITHNLLFNVMNHLADGGGIYISSMQGSSLKDGALVQGNVIHDALTSYNYGLYADYGASWVTIKDNVVYRADAPTILFVSPPMQHVQFIDNFWDVHPQGYGFAPETVTCTNNTELGKDVTEDNIKTHARCAAIVSTAGLEAPYRTLLKG